MWKALALLPLVAGPALADGMMNGVPIDCYCTDSKGKRVEVGEYICLHVDGRSFMAQCQMSLNVPMWREISPNCMSSRLDLETDEPVDPAVDTGGIHSKI